MNISLSFVNFLRFLFRKICFAFSFVNFHFSFVYLRWFIFCKKISLRYASAQGQQKRPGAKCHGSLKAIIIAAQLSAKKSYFCT